MKKHGLFLALIIVLVCASSSHALVEVEVLPTTTFNRGTGEPVTETVTFPGVAGPATVKLWNGNLQDDSVERVSSSTVTVNGQEVFGPSNFNQNVDCLEAEAALVDGQNTLEVCLKGKPGGQVRIQIIHDVYNVKVDPKAVALIEIGGTSQLTVTGHLSDGTEVDITSASWGTTYVSEDINVATVTDQGSITSVANGATTVTINNDSFSQDVSVFVPIDEAMLAAIDPDKVEEDPETGEEIVVNRLLVGFAEGMAISGIQLIIDSVGAQIVGFIPLSNEYLLELQTNTIAELEAVASQLESINGVETILEDLMMYPDSTPIDIEGLNATRKSAYRIIEVIGPDVGDDGDIWNYIENSGVCVHDVKAAIIDTGFLPDTGTDEFENYKFIDPSAPGSEGQDLDATSHGTRVAGIIGARNNNPAEDPDNDGEIDAVNGVLSGLSNNNRMFIYACATPKYKLLDILQKKRYSISGFYVKIALQDITKHNQENPDNQIAIVNMSYGLTRSSVNGSKWRDIKQAYRFHFSENPKTLFVASAGNDNGLAKNHLPSALTLECDNVISVAATKQGLWGVLSWEWLKDWFEPGFSISDTPQDERLGCSNHGDAIDIAAPGSLVWTTNPEGPDGKLDTSDDYVGYGPFGATSAAAPLVSGVAGLMKSINPNLEPADLKRIIHDTGDDITTDKPISGKRLNAFNAIRGAIFSQISPELRSPSNNEPNVDPNDMTFEWDPVEHPAGHQVEYCVTIKEAGDIPVFTGCDNNEFTPGTSLYLTEPILEYGKTYWWAVWAKDENGNWSQASEWWTFATEQTQPNGLVAYYPLDGNANDQSSNGNHGTEHNGVTYVNGVLGQAASFDGIDDYIAIPGFLDAQVESFSISVWALPKSNINGRVVYKGANTGSAFISASNNQTAFSVHLAQNGWYSAIYTADVADQFVHIVGNYFKGNKIEIWVNGEYRGETLLPLDSLYYDNYHFSSIGVWNRGEDYFFEGLIDEVRIYNRALSAVEIQQLFGDPDGDGIYNDGDSSGISGDNPCTGGNTLNCDDNCPNIPNSDQADSDGDGIGDTCEAPQVTRPIPDTGQTMCYNDYIQIACPNPGEPFCGQDANYTINPPSYAKLDANGNEGTNPDGSWSMVRDNVTGLIWEAKMDDGSIHDRDNTYNWSNAQDVFVAQLNTDSFGGYSDWRIPTAKELAFILNSGTYFPAIETSCFPNTVSDCYWSSTTRADTTDYAFHVYFNIGSAGYGYKSRTHNVRAVRGGQPEPSDRFIDNTDGTVTDTSTGLMWRQATVGEMTWKDALSFCETLILNNDGQWTNDVPNASGTKHDDWRLPGRNELHSLVDYSACNPAIDSLYFPNTVSDCYWSSTANAYWTNYAYHVSFSYGGLYAHYKTVRYYVRPVRGGQN